MGGGAVPIQNQTVILHDILDIVSQIGVQEDKSHLGHLHGAQQRLFAVPCPK